MTPQERDQLTLFLKQLAEARVGTKDGEADKLIHEMASKQADAAYLLVQRSMLVEQALNVAKAQIAELQSQVQKTQAGNRNSGFLGGGNPWAQSMDGGANSGGVPGAGSYQLPHSAAGAYAAPAAPQQGSLLGGGGGSFLGNMATTAAGVVAGGFLFQGLENLMGHHPSSSFFGDSSGEKATEETVINNYYDTPADAGVARNDDWSQSDDSDDLFVDNDDPAPDLDDGDDSSWV